MFSPPARHISCSEKLNFRSQSQSKPPPAPSAADIMLMLRIRRERERWMPITIIGLEICEKATNNPQLGAKPGHNRGKLHDSLPRPQLRSCCSAPLTMSSLQLIPRLLQPATIELYCPWPIETRDLKPIIQILEPFINKVHNRLGMCSLYQTLHSTRSSTSNHGKMDTSCGKRMFVFV